MRFPIALLAILCTASALGADSTATIDVPGAQAVQAALKSSSQRDTWARQNAASFVLDHVLRAQAGDRARSNAFTSAETARIAELEKLRKTTDSDYEASLPAACFGRDCEERFAYNRCIGQYEMSPRFYRAVFDKFFSPASQKVLTPRLSSGAGTVWQQALALPANSEPLDSFPPISGSCTGATTSTSVATAGTAANSTAAVQAVAVDDSIKRAKAAGVNTTVFGLQLGDLVRLPVCPPQSMLSALLGQDVPAMCKKAEDSLSGYTSVVGTEAVLPWELAVAIPKASCPSWVANCKFFGHLTDGRLDAVLMMTTGLAVQKDVGATLQQKYGKTAAMLWKTYTNDQNASVQGLEMSWALPGLDVTFKGYSGGARDSNGSVLIETDAIARAVEQIDKEQQAKKQQL